MKRFSWSILLSLAVWLTACAAARAEDGLVVIGNREVLRLRAAASGMTPAQRAAQLDSRIVHVYELMSRDGLLVTANDIRATPAPDGTRITVHGMPLLTVTAQDAAANHMTLSELSRLWANRLQAAIAQGGPWGVADQYDDEMQRVDVAGR